MLTIVPNQDPAAKPSMRRRLVDAFRAEVDAQVGGGDFASREEVALALANEVVRADLTEALKAIVASHGTEEVLVDGERYRFHEPGSQSYASLVGPLQVERPTFRKVGVRNGPTVVALDLAAGLVHGVTPALASRIARGSTAAIAALDLAALAPMKGDVRAGWLVVTPSASAATTSSRPTSTRRHPVVGGPWRCCDSPTRTAPPIR